MTAYTYTIFDADPSSSGGCALPGHEDVELESDSVEEAVDAARDALEIVACGLSTADGYSVGQRLYALVWDANCTVVGSPTYTLTEEDLA